ncbi:MAG: hypothetical protein ACRDJC_04115 [Thermomicrobiales bacterium]
MLDAYRDLIDELLGTPSEIRGMVDAASEPDTPRAKHMIAEMRDRDRAVLARAQMMTRQENPYLRTLRLDAAADDRDLSTLLVEMETARGDLVSLLMNLSLKDWERPAIHETAGEITLADEVEQHVEFDEELRQRMRELMTSA